MTKKHRQERFWSVIAIGIVGVGVLFKLAFASPGPVRVGAGASSSGPDGGSAVVYETRLDQPVCGAGGSGGDRNP